MIRTSRPTSSTTPTYSCPIGCGSATGSMPRQAHRSEPHTQVAARRMTASVGSLIFGSSRCSTRTSPGAEMIAPLMVAFPSARFCRRGGLVLLVGDVLKPGGPVTVRGALVERDVRHEVGRRGTVPVLLTRRRVDHLARPGHDDFPVPGAKQGDALGDIEGLPNGVGMPRGAGARGEVDAAAGHAGRLGLADVNRVDVHVAGEPLRRPLQRGLLRLNVHLGCLPCLGPVVSGRPSSHSTDTTRSSPGQGGRVVPGHDRTPLARGASRNVGGVTSNRADVRDFLVTRRAKITPQQAGLTIYGGNRRVPGLRREEVAMLAGVSADYYTRLEKGNLSGVSDTVLEAIAEALQLDEAERLHLLDLARTANASPARARRRPVPQQVRPGIQFILDGMSDIPAFVRNR